MLQRLSNRQYVDVKYLEEFLEKHDSLSNNTQYGLKYDFLQINYHKVGSDQYTFAQFRCNKCKMATEPFFHLKSRENSIEFMTAFEEITSPLLKVDPVDITDYEPPEVEPPEPEYRCQFEDLRHQNDGVKKWHFKRQAEKNKLPKDELIALTAVVRPQEAQHQNDVMKQWWAKIEDDKRKAAMVDELFDLASRAGTKERGKQRLYAWLWPEDDKEEGFRFE